MPTYTTEVIQSLPYPQTPVGQELIVGLSNDLCVAQEFNVKFCFEINVLHSIWNLCATMYRFRCF